jgi:hypothetical protein
MKGTIFANGLPRGTQVKDVGVRWYRRLGGLQGWSGQVRKISPPPGFDHLILKLSVVSSCAVVVNRGREGVYGMWQWPAEGV